MHKKYHKFVVLALNEENGEIEVKKQFTYPIFEDKDQFLFLSADLDRLLDIAGEEASIYNMRMISKTDVMMSKEGNVTTLPIGMCDQDMLQLFYLFSPDFSKHLDVEPL